MPALATITNVYADFVQQAEAENLPQFPIKDRSGAVRLTAYCLSLVTDLESKDIKVLGTARSITSGKAWTLVSCTGFWNATAPERLQDNVVNTYPSSIVVLLDTLRCFLGNILQIKAEFANAMKTLALLSEVTCSSIDFQPLPLTASIEKALCLSLFELSAAARASPSLCHTLSESLLPGLLRTKGRHSQIDALGQDLQVGFSIMAFSPMFGSWSS